MMMDENMGISNNIDEEVVKELRETFNSGKTKQESWRRSQLKGLLKLLEDKEKDIFKALQHDLGKHPIESYRDEVGPSLKTLRYALKSLKKWMSWKKALIRLSKGLLLAFHTHFPHVFAELPLAAFPSSASLVPEPLGLVLIISSWNFPFGLSLEPLIGAIAAGNVVVLKPSELAPATSSLLATTIPIYLDTTCLKVVQGDAFVCQHLLQIKWDKIFFTGSANVGRIVMTAAAKNLTPTTMELGGKCPAIVDTLSTSWDKQVAVKRILAAKFGACAGQACIGIDYILVEKCYTNTLVELLKDWMLKTFGENPKKSMNITRIVNMNHFLRLKTLLDEPLVTSSIVYGGSYFHDNLFIEPTILLDPPLTSAVMTEEIFGPLLPIITLEKLEDCVQFIKSRPKPLAIYAFTKNETLQKQLISETSSGSILFNDAVIQYAADSLPFGGVGESGFGRYHGKYSFDNFSHEKAVMKRSYLLDFWFRYPPWTDQKLQIFRHIYLYDYLGILLVLLGFKKPT